MVSYDFQLFLLKLHETSGPTRGTNSMLFLVFRRDHLRSNLGIISGLGVICGRSLLRRYTLLFDLHPDINKHLPGSHDVGPKINSALQMHFPFLPHSEYICLHCPSCLHDSITKEQLTSEQ